MLLALCALLLAAAQPGAAHAEEEESGGWGLVETTPQGWPQPIYLPDFGELTMVGYDGATADDVTEPFDFEWTYDVEAGSGEIGLIQGFYLPGDAGDDPAVLWEEYDAQFAAGLAEEGVEIVSRDLDAQYGGRPWLFYHLRHPGLEAGDAAIDLFTMINFDESAGLTFLNVFPDMPASEDFDAMLSLVTGGPDAPQ
jgi:hypothetical protein